MAHSRDQAPRGRRPDELDRRERDEPPRRPAAERVLALQRSAGNRAVSDLLARSPDVKEAEKSAGAAGPRATLPGIGTIPLLSVSFGVHSGRGGPGSGSGKPPAVREVGLSSKVGEHSAKLMKATVDGQPMDVEIVLPSQEGAVRFKLKGATVSSYSTGSGGEERGTEVWTLNVQAIEQTSEAVSGE